MKLRVLIVDDEPIARQRVRRFLKDEADLEIIGERGDGASTVAAISKLRPDLVFLDVQMPELDGFQVISAVGAERMPAVVFVTAHDEFALRAFEAQALDYLLKPISHERFRAALQRARKFLAGDTGSEWQRQLAGLLAQLPTARSSATLAVRTSGGIVLLHPAEIEWVEAEGDYVRLHTATGAHLLRARMTELEERLGVDRFFRIHRSTLVNLDAVRAFRPVHVGESVVVLKNGHRLTASRACGQKLQERLDALG